jgi:Mn-dependent DtxR family transcriptional regulator
MGALDYRDRIRALIEQKPVQPTFVAKELMTNSMLASAMLSEMSEKGLLKVSHLKVGSSPLYYHPDHPEHLLDFVQHLNEKDRKTVNLLKEKKVLNDKELDPLTRVSLRNIKDFAKPLDVAIDGVKELFWKFYLLTDEQSADEIRQLFQKKEPAPEPQPAEAPKPQKARKPRAKKVKVEPQQTTIAQPAAEAPNPAVADAKPAEAPKAAEPMPIAPAEAASQALTGDDPFLQKLMAFFASSNITVLEQIALKKKSEYDFVLQLTSPVGNLHYYCKAKNKAKIGEADLSHAYVTGQLKKLPILFLSPGTLTKPASDLIKELKGLTVKQV